MEKRRQSLSPPEKTERPQTFSGFQRTLMLAGGTIHQEESPWVFLGMVSLWYRKETLLVDRPLATVLESVHLGMVNMKEQALFTIASRICQENNSEEVETVPELKEEAPQPAAAAAAAAPTVAAAGAGAAGPPGRRNPPGGKSSLILG
ncbi:uncharacterized protein LOC117422910 isoform X2 [Acipenser ruthenus]|uniref:uncharacterized protein LOC117422910 isoform X2 n=1 Tax=Acipenser ruthenus TaxID=7906 RepID=UPI00274168A2|nr:uncharacterized protein LOC117422910 isoform X2 [Acipenser ruthenus]